MVKPASETELAEIVRQGGSFEICGSASKRRLGRHAPQEQVLDMSGFSGVALYEPDELMLEAGSATPLAEIERLLAQNAQQLAFEPPDYARLLGVNGRGTLGGMMSCALAGPRRIKAGGPRDHVLGFSGVSGRGEVFKAGGRVVKNVTGFDISKLMVGAFGTLVALSRITLKVLPAAETEETLVLQGLSDTRAVEAMSLAMQSSCEVSGASHLPGSRTLLRLEGVRPSVTYRRDKLAALLKAFGAVEIIPEKLSRATWKDIGDVAALADEDQRQVWKLSVAPSHSSAIIAKLQSQLDIRYIMDWAGGLIWLSVPAAPDASASIIRRSFSSGHATLMRASDEVRSQVEVFQPQNAALHALSARVKTAFDPKALFNPGRMYQDI